MVVGLGVKSLEFYIISFLPNFYFLIYFFINLRHLLWVHHIVRITVAVIQCIYFIFFPNISL